MTLRKKGAGASLPPLRRKRDTVQPAAPLRRKKKAQTKPSSPVQELPQEAPVSPAPGTDNPVLEGILADMATLKKEALAFTAQNSKEFRELEARAIDIMHKAGIKKYVGATASGTLAEPEVAVVDIEKLRASVDPAVFAKVTKEVVVPEYLDSAIRLKEVSESVVNDCTTWKATKPYVRATVL